MRNNHLVEKYQNNTDAILEVWKLMTEWLIKLEKIPGWTEFNRNKVLYTIYFDKEDNESIEKVYEFKFDEEIEKEYNVLMCFLELVGTLDALKNCEYYFRRFPFKGLPIDHFSYLTNNCELYFNKFYEFKERLKKLGKSIEILSPAKYINIGDLISNYSKLFAYELKERNLLHHHSRFDDVMFQKIRLIALIEDKKNFPHLDSSKEYRKTCKEWIDRIRLKSQLVESILENVAKAMLECCDFLKNNQNTTSD